MRRAMTWLVALLGAIGAAVGGDDPAARRVVAGRCAPADGRVPAGGRIYFKPDHRAHAFLEAWSAPLDGEGRYRVELVDAVQRSLANGEPVRSRADGPLRFEVLAPGFRAEAGPVAGEGGREALAFDVPLTPEAWRETELQLVDVAGRPVAAGEVTLELAASKEWARVRADAAGVCRVSTPPGRFFAINARGPGSTLTNLTLGGAADQPTRIRVPIRAPIRGRVVDPEGRPVAGLRLGRLIASPDEAETDEARRRFDLLPFARGESHPVTDADGRFELALPFKLAGRGLDKAGEFRTFPQAVCLADADCRRVAFVAVDWKQPLPSYDFVLRPARRVRFPVEHGVAVAAGSLQTWWELTGMTDALGAALPTYVMHGSAHRESGGATAAAPGDRIEAYLPPGRYEIEISSADPNALGGAEKGTTELVVPAGEGPVDLPAVVLPPLVHNRMVGRPAPEIDAKDLDTGAPVRLADLKGRVVLVDFWGHWCGPCLAALPELIAIHDEFRDRPVTIVALHDQSVQTRAAYDAKLATVRRQMWGDRDLPFRVALDRPLPDVPPTDPGNGRGASCELYDVHAFPTTFLIDRAGKIAGTVDARDRGQVSARIKELLAAPAAR